MVSVQVELYGWHSVSSREVEHDASSRGARMLAAREEIIERILKSVESHVLDDAELVATCIHATAAALIEVTGVTSRQAGEALQTSIRRYVIDMASPTD